MAVTEYSRLQASLLLQLQSWAGYDSVKSLQIQPWKGSSGEKDLLEQLGLSSAVAVPEKRVEKSPIASPATPLRQTTRQDGPARRSPQPSAALSSLRSHNVAPQALNQSSSAMPSQLTQQLTVPRPQQSADIAVRPTEPIAAARPPREVHAIATQPLQTAAAAHMSTPPQAAAASNDPFSASSSAALVMQRQPIPAEANQNDQHRDYEDAAAVESDDEDDSEEEYDDWAAAPASLSVLEDPFASMFPTSLINASANDTSFLDAQPYAGGGEQSAEYFDIALPDLTFLLATNLQTRTQ